MKKNILIILIILFLIFFIIMFINEKNKVLADENAREFFSTINSKSNKPERQEEKAMKDK